MPFEPRVGDVLEIEGQRYAVAEHPAAPGIAYGQEGRAGIVYCLEALTPSPGPAGHPLPLSRSAGEGEGARGEGVRVRAALKVFKPRFRLPYLVSQAERIAPFAALPGLAACRRTVLTPQRHAGLLRQHPDLTYAVLMPWIEGPTWQEVLLDRQPFSPERSLALARGLADVLSVLEQQGIAHCDLSAPNVMLPALALTPTPGGSAATPFPSPNLGRGEGGRGDGVRADVQLVDLEGLYALGMVRPQELSSGSMGYAHHQAAGGLWGPEADRFAGAVLLAEMLGWCDPQVVQAAWSESYFDPAEMQRDGPRYRTLLESLRRNWGDGVAALFERAWRSDALADCPTFGEWLVALPERPPVGQAVSLSTPRPAAEAAPPVLSPQEPLAAAEEGVRAEIRAFLQAARRMEEKNDLRSAQALYQQALELAQSDPTLRGMAQEIELVLQEVQTRLSAEARGVSSASEERPIRYREPAKVTSTPIESPGEIPALQQPGWRFLALWVLASLLGLSLLSVFNYVAGKVAGEWYGGWSWLWYTGQVIDRRVGIQTSGFLLAGVMIGIAQWLILRNYIKIKKTTWWILASSLGWIAGLIAWGLFGEAVYYWWDLPRMPINGAMIGAGLGLAQWFILRRQFRHAGWWVLTNAVAWGFVFWLESVFSSIILFGKRGIVQELWFTLERTWREVTTGAMLGTMIGIAQWAVLRRSLQKAEWWILLNAVVWACLGALDPRGIGIAYRTVERTLVMIEIDSLIGCFVLGTVIGTMQWLFLRRQFRDAPWWILITALGWAIGWTASWYVIDKVTPLTRDNLDVGTLTTISAIVSGVIPGIMQWLYLRGQIGKAGWWILATAIGWVAGVALIRTLGGNVAYGLAFDLFGVSFDTGWISVEGGFSPIDLDQLAQGIMIGLLTGSVLIWLLRHPRVEEGGRQ